MLSIIVGIVILVLVAASLIYSFSQTPENLSGFYGLFYILIAAGGVIGGLYLIGVNVFGLL